MKPAGIGTVWRGEASDEPPSSADAGFDAPNPAREDARPTESSKMNHFRSVIVIFLTATLFGNLARAELKTNIEYGKAGNRALLLDANVPDGTGPFPVVIAIHGGGWCTGNKSGKGDFAPALKALTANHFTWFSIDYRLAPTNRWPDCYDDVQAAIRWGKAHAAEYKGDPDHIALLGYSAGGHLACLAATLAGPDTRVQAVVGLAPPTDLAADAQHRGSLKKWPAMRNLLGRDSLDDETLKLLWQMSPINHVQSGLPPFLLMQGDSDKTVLPSLTRNFAARLKEKGVPYELYFLKGPGHRIADWEKFDPTWQQKLADWLNQTLVVKK